MNQALFIAMTTLGGKQLLGGGTFTLDHSFRGFGQRSAGLMFLTLRISWQRIVYLVGVCSVTYNSAEGSRHKIRSSKVSLP